MVDGRAEATLLRSFAQPQLAAAHGHLAIGRDDIDVIRLDSQAIGGLADGQGRVPAEQFNHQTFVSGIEMRHEDECQAAVGRHMRQEAFEGFQAAGRGADADDGDAARLPEGTRRPGLARRHLAEALCPSGISGRRRNRRRGVFFSWRPLRRFLRTRLPKVVREKRAPGRTEAGTFGGVGSRLVWMSISLRSSRRPSRVTAPCHSRQHPIRRGVNGLSGNP